MEPSLSDEELRIVRRMIQDRRNTEAEQALDESIPTGDDY